MKIWARSSVVERCSDKTEVGGSIPPVPTILENLFTKKDYTKL